MIQHDFNQLEHLIQQRLQRACMPSGDRLPDPVVVLSMLATLPSMKPDESMAQWLRRGREGNVIPFPAVRFKPVAQFLRQAAASEKEDAIGELNITTQDQQFMLHASISTDTIALKLKGLGVAASLFANKYMGISQGGKRQHERTIAIMQLNELGGGECHIANSQAAREALVSLQVVELIQQPDG